MNNDNKLLMGEYYEERQILKKQCNVTMKRADQKTNEYWKLILRPMNRKTANEWPKQTQEEKTVCSSCDRNRNSIIINEILKPVTTDRQPHYVMRATMEEKIISEMKTNMCMVIWWKIWRKEEIMEAYNDKK